MLPTLEETRKLYNFFKDKTDALNIAAGEPKGLSAKHCENVAYVASRIAEAASMDANKAYILGLFHDCGGYIEHTVKGTFHGTAGYDLMMEKGFDEVARTCLSHSFYNADFNIEDFASYDTKELQRAKQLLQLQSWDDYDRLIYLADKMAPYDYIDTVENRVEMIRTRYHLSDERAVRLLRESRDIKNYFDERCGQDIYQILDLL
jgi:HD superfamily phosphodiesterase